MIPGGIADKLGNRYEAKWLVRCLMDIIADKAKWLNFESVETEYQGFEFAIARGEITEWHQTKVNAPKGNWTLNTLKNEGVLKAFSNRLSTDSNAHCFFISQDHAKDLRLLADKARTANSHIQYSEILSKEQNDIFQQLNRVWLQPDEVIFEWLNRCHFELFPERELDSLIESFGDLYFHQGGKTAFPILRDILENHFNKTLTTEALRRLVKSHGALKFKEWAFDPTIQQRLNEETEAYLKTYTPFGAGGETIARIQSSNLIEELLNQNGPELILLAGVAGSGKSGVVRSAIEQLHKRGILHLAFRVDQYLSCGTREELGKKLTGREESPVSTLKGISPTVTTVLFIDQVDAISEVSGRDGQIKEVIFRLITDAHYLGSMKIVVVCRTFDLDSDSRLKSLKEANRTKQIDVPLLDWNADIEPLLKNKGIDVSIFREPQRQLLCLPVNLAVFLEIDNPKLSFHSRSNLHEKLIEKKQRVISQGRHISWSLIKALTALCDWMTERQQLSAPASVLDDFPKADDILTSEGLIIASRGQVNFFHESFFDYVYARAFLTRNQSLVDLLTAAEQHLFRRTQIRQILESLRQNDKGRYLTELSSVLFCNDVRFHIKLAICQWLNSIDKPTEAEFNIVSQFNESGGKFHQFFRYAALSPIWFDLLNSKDWIRQQLDGSNQERGEEVLWWLSNIAGEHPKEIADLLRSWWGRHPERSTRLLSWFGFIRRNKPDDNLLLLCEELINSRPDDLFQLQAPDRIEMLLYAWSEKSPELCGRLLHALFDAWFALNPDGNLFANDSLKILDKHSLTEIAKKAPHAFLLGTTDALLKAIDKVIQESENGENGYDFNQRYYSRDYQSGFDGFLAMYRSSLKQVLQQIPANANSYLDKLDPYKHNCLMHLHLEAIQANPAALASRLPELVSNPMIFDAGFNGADWYSFAHACRAVLPHLTSEERKVIEQIIFNYKPEIKNSASLLKYINQNGETEPFWTKKSVIHRLNCSGYTQWCILETIGNEYLDATSLLKLLELRRKFPAEKIPEPKDFITTSSIGSPIKRPQCEKMSDRHWLSAIKRYDNDEERRRGPNFVDGGASDLAHEIEIAAKKDPTRFAALSLSIPDTAPTCYIERILSGLAESETATDETLTVAVKHAYRHPRKSFGSSIARLVGKHPQIAVDTEILELLIWYALNGEAAEDKESDIKNTEQETITINTLIQHGDSLHIRGINGTRGWMWETLASVLWQVPETTLRIWEALEIALEKESLISVRCCMMKPLSPLFNADKARFTESIRKLIILPDGAPQKNDAIRLSPLITHQGIHLFPYIFGWLPELANDLVKKLLECEDETKQLIGAWLIFYESFRNDDFITRADQLALLSLNHRRLLAKVSADAITWTGNRYRAETLLKVFFFDEDEQIRKHAANAFGKVQAKEVELYRELTAIFLHSPAFSGNSYAVLRMLEIATCDVLDLVIAASERLIIEVDQNGRRTTDIYHLEKILKQEYVSSESQPEARKKILDMIDLLIANEIHGADSIVTAHDRW